MKEQTQKNLSEAFAGESQAHMKYMVFAELAEREGLANVARLFRAASYSEQIHATNHLRALGVGKTAENLAAAHGGETHEITAMYPEFVGMAAEEGEKRAKGSMENALAAEKVHAQLYAQAMAAVATAADAALAPVFVCDVCGFTMHGEAPERCPICGAVHTRFRQF